MFLTARSTNLDCDFQPHPKNKTCVTFIISRVGCAIFQGSKFYNFQVVSLGNPIAIEVVVVIPSAQPGNVSLAKGSGRSNGEWDPGLPEKSGKSLQKLWAVLWKNTHHMSASPLWESLSTIPNYIWQDTFWLMILGILPGSNWSWQERNNPSGPATHFACHRTMNLFGRMRKNDDCRESPLDRCRWEWWTVEMFGHERWRCRCHEDLVLVHFLAHEGNSGEMGCQCYISGSTSFREFLFSSFFSGLLYFILPWCDGIFACPPYHTLRFSECSISGWESPQVPLQIAD